MNGDQGWVISAGLSSTTGLTIGLFLVFVLWSIVIPEIVIRKWSRRNELGTRHNRNRTDSDRHGRNHRHGLHAQER